MTGLWREDDDLDDILGLLSFIILSTLRCINILSATFVRWGSSLPINNTLYGYGIP